MAQSNIQLTEDQKSLASKLVSEGLPIGDITKMVFANESLDGRSLEGKAIKGFLVDRGQGDSIKTTKFERTSGDFNLTKEQKEIIDVNLDQVQNTMEMAKLVFQVGGSDKIEPLSKEFKAVFNYMKSAGSGSNSNDEPVDEITYKPPVAIQHVIGRANTYVTRKNSQKGKAYDWNQLTKDDRKNLESLVGYMNIQRFVYQASQYTKKIDRILFESNFIRYAHDKPDLTEEEVDQYISLCEEVVLTTSASRRKIRLEQEVDNAIDSENRTVVSMSIVEAIKDLKKEIEDSKKRQEKLINILSGTRKDRIKGKENRNASILNLVEAWQKQEKRHELIELGEKEHEKDKKEVERLSDMDAVIALIAGLTKDEAYH